MSQEESKAYFEAPSSTFDVADTTPRDGGAWFDIEPSLQGSLVVKAHIKNQGYIAASGLYILYPAIVQGKNGTVEIAFSITNGTTIPSAAYAVVLRWQEQQECWRDLRGCYGQCILL